jgi:hypothetical protein
VEEQARAHEVPEKQQHEHQGDEPRGQDLLARVDEHVVEGVLQHAEQGQARVGAEAEAEPDPAERAPAEEQAGREAEAVGHRDLGRDRPELELDGEPGGAPDEGGDEEEEPGC